jgi:hypothetical protein
MGPLGFNELMVILIIGGGLIVLPIVFIYRYGKQKGRLQELEKQQAEKNKQ